MNLYLALPLVALAVNGVLAVVAFRGGWQATGRRPFALFLAGMASWGGLLYLMRSSTSLDEARWWDELVVMNFAFITTLYLHFTYPLSGRRPRRYLLPGAYALLAVFAGVTLGGFTISGMQLKPYGFAPVPGPGFIPLLAFTYGAIGLGMVNVHRALRHGYTPDLRNRASYLMAGTGLSLLGTVSDILPVLGVPIYPLGIVSAASRSALANGRRDRLNSSRPSSTSRWASQEKGARLVYQGQRVSWEWQSKQARIASSRVRGLSIAGSANTGGLVWARP